MAPDVPDPAQVRRPVGQGAERGHDRGELADVVQVDVDALDAGATGDGEPVGAEHDQTAHPLQELAHRSPAWVVCSGQSRTVTEPPVVAASPRNAAALDRSGSIVWSTARIGPGATRQRSGSESSTSTPWLTEHRDRHLDVRTRRHGLAVVQEVEPLVETRPGEQEGRHELARPGRVEDDAPAPHVTGAVDGEREGVALDRDPERPQGGEHLADGSRPHVGVTVERHGSVGESGHRRHEPGDGAGEPAVDPAAADQAPGIDAPVVSVGVERERPARSGRRPSAGCRASGGRGVRRTDPSASEASTRARLVSDLLPGSETVARTGPRACGAAHGAVVGGALVTAAGYRAARRTRVSSGGPWRPAPRPVPAAGGAVPRGVRRGPPAGPARRRPACPPCRPRPAADHPSSRRS